MLQKWGLLSKHSSTAGSAVDNNDTSEALSAGPGPTKRPRPTEETTRTPADSQTVRNSIDCGDNTTSTSSTAAMPVRLDSSYAQLYGAELDPVGFSYFLAANMPISSEDLQSLLEAQDVVDRLRCTLR